MLNCNDLTRPWNFFVSFAFLLFMRMSKNVNVFTCYQLSVSTTKALTIKNRKKVSTEQIATHTIVKTAPVEGKKNIVRVSHSLLALRFFFVHDKSTRSLKENCLRSDEENARQINGEKKARKKRKANEGMRWVSHTSVDTTRQKKTRTQFFTFRNKIHSLVNDWIRANDATPVARLISEWLRTRFGT